MKDSYHTIEGECTGEFKDRGSKFIAYAYPVYTQEEWQGYLKALKQEHFKSRHHCYAFRMGIDQNNFRTNDDGEPSGTAGRPILGQIDRLGLTNIIVIVVRYFGGTKLGTSGLINAYRESTKIALAEATIIERIIEDVYQLEFDYLQMSRVMNAVKKYDLEICKQDFGVNGNLHLAIRKGDVEEKLKLLTAAIADIHLEEVETLEKTEGFELSYLYTR